MFKNLLGILLCCSVGHTRSSNITPLLHFLHKRFPFCESLFVGVNSNFDNIPFSNSVSAGNYIATIKETSPNVNFLRLKDIHRHIYNHCGIAFISIESSSTKTARQLFEVVTPRYVPIIRKDEDYFVFLFKEKTESDKILLSPEFGSKIKFKLGLILEQSNNLFANTVDLYGNGGKPIIKPLNLKPSDIAVSSLFPDTTSNFHGKTFRVANPKAPFYFQMEPYPSGRGNRPLRGLYKVWLDVMMHRFNFTIDLFQSSLSGGTGKRLSNGTWLGAVADVLHEHADMAVYIGHIYNRHEFVEWSTPLTYEWLVFITHKPKVFFDPAAIFRPFPLILWIGLIVSMIFISISLKFLVSSFSNEVKGSKFFPGKVFLYLFSSFLEQDADCYLSVLDLSPVRVMVAFWLMFALILSTAHRAKLVGLLAFPALNFVPSTFDELANSNYRVGVNVLGKGGAAYSVLSTSKNPVYKTLFEKMEIFPDPAVCLRQALNENIGCIMWQSVADYTEAKNFTDKFGRKPFRSSFQTTSFIDDGYIWEKRAIFRQNFDRITWSIVETGLRQFWFLSDLESEKKKRLDYERTLVDSPSNEQETGTESSENLKLIHFKGLFYVLVLGLICAFLSFFIETRHLFFKSFGAVRKRIRGALSRLNQHGSVNKQQRNSFMPMLVLKNEGRKGKFFNRLRNKRV